LINFSDGSTANVSAGNVCIGGNDTNPTSVVNCGLWADCVVNETVADQYYVGFAGDGTNTCTSTGWVASGTTLSASSGYFFNTDVDGATCTQTAESGALNDENNLTGAIIDTFVNGVVGFGAVAIILGMLLSVGIGVAVYNRYLKK